MGRLQSISCYSIVVKGKQGPGKECPVMMTGSFHRMQTAPYHYGHLRKDFCREERDLRSIVSIQVKASWV